eukprot:COSAG05_NODE_1154_length_5691_cov_13.432225_3_plen_495_part_00
MEVPEGKHAGESFDVEIVTSDNAAADTLVLPEDLKALCELGAVSEVESILDQRQLDVDIRDETHGATLLMFASGLEDDQMVATLLGRGANPDAQNRDGGTALMLAASLDCAPVAELLIQAGASVQLTNHMGKTALELAQGGVLSILQAVNEQDEATVSPMVAVEADQGKEEEEEEEEEEEAEEAEEAEEEPEPEVEPESEPGLQLPASEKSLKPSLSSWFANNAPVQGGSVGAGGEEGSQSVPAGGAEGAPFDAAAAAELAKAEAKPRMSDYFKKNAPMSNPVTPVVGLAAVEFEAGTVEAELTMLLTDSGGDDGGSNSKEEEDTLAAELARLLQGSSSEEEPAEEDETSQVDSLGDLLMADNSTEESMAASLEASLAELLLDEQPYDEGAAAAAAAAAAAENVAVREVRTVFLSAKSKWMENEEYVLLSEPGRVRVRACACVCVRARVCAHARGRGCCIDRGTRSCTAIVNRGGLRAGRQQLNPSPPADPYAQ